MTAHFNPSPINEVALDEHWFSLRISVWDAVRKVVKACGVDQKLLADRIGMDPGQFNKVVTGKKSNVTLRTLHNIARATNHRLRISLEPLAGLPKPNYSYEARTRESSSLFIRETKLDTPESWTEQRELESAVHNG